MNFNVGIEAVTVAAGDTGGEAAGAAFAGGAQCRIEGVGMGLPEQLRPGLADY